MAMGKHKTSARPGDATYDATWSGYSAAPHCGCICPKCGTEVHIEGDSHYCPWCDDYVNTGEFCDQAAIERAENEAYFGDGAAPGETFQDCESCGASVPVDIHWSGEPVWCLECYNAALE